MATKKKKSKGHAPGMSGQKKDPTGKQLRELNGKERRLLSILVAHGDVMTLKQLGIEAFGPSAPFNVHAISPMRANSWARNSLRNLVSEGYVINLHTSPAKYKPGVVPAGTLYTKQRAW